MKRICMTLAAFALALSLSAQEKPYKVYLVSTAHFDNQWNWDVRESIDDYLHRTMVQNFYLFEKFPDYVFNFESAQKYSWMKEYYPKEFEKVREYVKAGRWNVCGSTWEANDPNIPSSESFFRNILLGQEFYKREFGVKSNDIYLPDCFGFGYTLPTIAAHSGLKGFSTQKLQWRKAAFYGEPPKEGNDGPFRRTQYIDNKYKIPFPIGIWQGIDGSRILGALDTGGYGTSYYYDDITVNQRIIDRAKMNPDGVAYSYYGVGDRGGSPTLPSVWSMEQALKGNGPLKVISARAGQIYEDYFPLENHPNLPVFDGELTMDVHGVGCYSSQAMLKAFNRRNEHLADAAERASVVAELLGGLEYPADELRENWQRFLWHQFHDDITGTSIPQAYTFSWNDHLIAQNRFSDAITTAVGSVARALDTRVDGTALVVYNPVAASRRDLVRAGVPMASKPSGVVVMSSKGKVPAQLLGWKDGKADIIFSAQVDPVSFSVFSVKAAGKSASGNLKVGVNSIENRIYKVVLNENGDIASIIDKRYGKQMVDPERPYRLMVLTDHTSNDYPAWEIYKTTVDGPSSPVDGNVRISVAEIGPLRASLKVERDFEGSHFVQYISLTDGAADDRIEIANEVDWVGKNALLKAEFPTTVSNELTSYDLGIGYIKRGVNKESAFEVIGHQWADLTDEDGSYGVSILNDSKYGWDKPDKQTIRLTLLNTPHCERGFIYQAHQDHGHHEFKYAIVGHKGQFTDSGIAEKAEGFNQNLMAFLTPKHSGQLGKTYSFARSDNSQVAVMAMKKAEDGTGYIIRVNEMDGKDYDKASIIFSMPVESAVETNGIEEQAGPASFEGNRLTFSGKAFQPKTFKVVFKDKGILSRPSDIFVDLDYNAVAFTTDEFNRAGNFDRTGNSLAAELMPEVVKSDGISFNVCNDPTINDFVRADGQTVTLPEHKGATKLFLLLTSIDGNRRATFKVDGKDYDVKVPYYSDFFGQWSWKGESEGYLKEGSFGYIANHKHSERKGNDSYNFAYLYKVCLDIPEDARTLELPKDAGIAVFAATLANDPNHDTVAASPMRIIPAQTVPVEYTTRPVPFFRERSLW